MVIEEYVFQCLNYRQQVSTNMY